MTHNINPTQDTHFLRGEAERGNRSAGAVVKAREFSAAGKYEQAIAEYKRAAETGWTAYDEWGDLLEAKGDHAGAVRVYREMIYGSGLYIDNEGHTVPSPRDWNEQGRSLRAQLMQKPISGRPTSGSITPAGSMRYALLLVKGGQYEEAVQVRKWCVEVMGSRYDKVYKTYEWLLTPFNAEEVRRDPSLFVAQAWIIIGIFDTTRRTDDYPGLLASIRLKKAVAARPDFAPAWLLLAERYRDIGDYLEPAYLPLAVEAYKNAAYYDSKSSKSLLKSTDSGNKVSSKAAVAIKAANAMKEIKAGQKGATLLYY